MAESYEALKAQTAQRLGRAHRWAEVAANWGSSSSACEVCFVAPGRVHDWPRELPGFEHIAHHVRQDRDRMTVDALVDRALAGDPRARTLHFRASRGMARPVEVSSPAPQQEPIHSEIAEAMISAGLDAHDRLVAAGVIKDKVFGQP